MANTNDFYDTDNYTALSRLALARAEDVNAFNTALSAAFDLLPSKARQYEGRVIYCGTCAGSVNAETCTAPYTITATDGLHLRVRAAFTNTAAMTLNPSSLGNISVRKYDGTALSAGDWLAGAFYDVVYNSSSAVFRIVNPVVSITGGVTAFDISGLTAETAPDDADVAPIFDNSAGQNRKITLPNVLVNGWTANTAPLDADTLLTLKSSSGLLRKVTLANLMVSGWTEVTAIDPVADYVLVYDASAGVLKKTLTREIVDDYTAFLKTQFFAGQ